MNMRSAAGRILLFCVTAVSAYIVLFVTLYFIRPGGVPLVFRAVPGNVWPGGGSYVKFRQFDPHSKYDIVILGSSHAYRGYDPRNFEALGYKTFNLGSTDQNLICSYWVARGYLNHSNCKMVILDMYDRVFSQENLEPFSDLIQNMTDDRTAIRLAMASHDLRTFNTVALRFCNKFIAPLNTDTLGYYSGFLPTDGYVKVPVKRRLTWKYRTNERQMHYLEMLLDYFKAEGIAVVLTEHPMPAVYAPRDHALFVNDIHQVAQKHHIVFYDYMKADHMTGLELFSDETHLNIRGVAAYNRKLITDMQHDDLLPAVISEQIKTTP